VLTGELLRVRRKGDEILPRYLSRKQRELLLPIAADLIGAVERGKSARRMDLGAALDDVPCRPTDRLVVAGLRKLLLDRCEFAVAEGPDPVELRAELFTLAAARRRELGPTESFARDAVVEQAAARLGVEPSTLQQRLFADLRDNERLVAFRAIEPAALLERYDVALAQAILLRARRVVLELDGEAPARLRALFRSARFHGLLHRLERVSTTAYRVELDGPLSLFSQSKRYGLKLAMFLPAVLRCRSWQLEADLLWGKQRQAARFRLDAERGLTVPGAPRGRGAVRLSPAVEELRQRFEALGSAWTVRPNDEIIALPDEAVCVPDLVFENAATGEQVFLEVFGFWSRHAVWQRVETISRGFPGRIILAVGKHLRVSEEVLDQEEAGEIYVYRTKMSAKAILARLDLPAR
jgi:predicted nuclease of restriction endonuclease-like RecB superfamily